MKLPKPRQKENGKWIIEVMVDGVRTSKQFDTEEEAIYWAVGLKTKQKETFGSKNSPTLARLFKNYIDARTEVLSPTTLRSYRNIQENYFSALMTKPANEITQLDIQKEINKMAKNKSAKTIKNAVALLISVLPDDNRINIRRLTFPAKNDTEHKFLEGQDIAKLIDVIRDDKYEIPILLALWLGMRRSEICALEWSDFDFKKKTVKITKALVPDSNNQFVLKHTAKTAKSARTLNVPDYVISRLFALQATTGIKEGRITTVYPNDIYNHLKVICEKNDIPFVGVHGLRHTNASVMLSIGITTKMAMARGGWSNQKTMQDIYQHLFSEDKNEAAIKIDEYFENLMNPAKK